jgi:putative isomerase
MAVGGTFTVSRFFRITSGLSLAALLVALVGCGEETLPEASLDVLDFPNVLDVRGRPADARDLTVYSFSDLGAWFNFGLPDLSSPDLWGGFTGPFLLNQGGSWLSPSFARLYVEDVSSGDALDWSRSLDASQLYYPGRLLQTFSSDSLEVRLDLIFVTSSTALIRAHLTNAGTESRRLRTGWSGDVMIEGASLDSLPDGVSVTFPIDPSLVDLSMGGSDVQVEIDGNSYRALGGETVLAAGDSVTRYATISVFADSIERGALLASGAAEVSDPEGQFADNHDRWSGYLAAAYDALDLRFSSAEYGSVVVKAVETLLTNWRSAYGHLFHDGLFPSYAYRGFHGVWSWDSWKHARALTNFAPELAKDQLRVMFDYQDQYGMVPDVIYADSTENNWRDTKPPLSAWAVWAIYERTADLAFLEEMYLHLWRYHEWWYANRDHDVNGLCEYGSTDGSRVAAGWESGMDNAVRFDSAAMVQNNDRAWSLNQESVDLNSYLYAEKLYLASMAEVLGRVRDVALLRAAAEDLRDQIRSTMFDEETGYFYDVDIETKRPLLVQGPEGWVPLWAGVATEEQAARVVRVMMDPEKFATNVPFPTLAADHENFDPRDGYWRGSVWLDQAYFAVKGLERYGYFDEADEMRARLFENADGLLADAPIYENYHPLTGEPLNAPHFSWSAAHYLLLLEPSERAER